MFEIKGKYATATIFTDNVEETAISQIYELCNQDFAQGSSIKIMSDVHAGKGCVVGFTAKLGDKVIPNLIGVDIGCGVLVIELGKMDNPNLEDLDKVIRAYVPSGHNIHEEAKHSMFVEGYYCAKEFKNSGNFAKSIGTLGGGNHFIELNKDDEDNYYLVIHSGSRNLGKQVAEIYQKKAVEACREFTPEIISKWKKDTIKDLKKNGNQKYINAALKLIDKAVEKSKNKYPEHLCFLEGLGAQDYLHDMDLAQQYASQNRMEMAEIIIKYWLKKSVGDFENFSSVHNYIEFVGYDYNNGIMRKGAIKADKGQKVIIPLNMRDGSIIGIGKGNEFWNNSAPHGAGRIMSRSKAKESFTMEEYQESMNGIYSTSVSEATLDESPMSYKPMDEIVDAIGGTVEITKIIKPVYNFKAS